MKTVGKVPGIYEAPSYRSTIDEETRRIKELIKTPLVNSTIYQTSGADGDASSMDFIPSKKGNNPNDSRRSIFFEGKTRASQDKGPNHKPGSKSTSHLLIETQPKLLSNDLPSIRNSQTSQSASKLHSAFKSRGTKKTRGSSFNFNITPNGLKTSQKQIKKAFGSFSTKNSFNMNSKGSDDLAKINENRQKNKRVSTGKLQSLIWQGDLKDDLSPSFDRNFLTRGPGGVSDIGWFNSHLGEMTRDKSSFLIGHRKSIV